MNKKIFGWSIWGAILVTITGTLLHFGYSSTNNFWVGFIAPINESVWEHMKLVFYPVLFFSVIEWLTYSKKPDKFWFSVLLQEFIGIAFIMIFFYTYTSLVRHSILAFDIGSFVLAIVLAKIVHFQLLTKKSNFAISNFVAVTYLLALLTFFVICTVNPPRNRIFIDPNENTYGIYQLNQ